MNKSKSVATCSITGKKLPLADLVPIYAIRRPILDLIVKDHPDLDLDGYVSKKELHQYNQIYVTKILQEEKGQLTDLEKEVVERMGAGEFISTNIEPQLEKSSTLGDRLADKIAEFGGSWKFIIIFVSFMAVWMTINAQWLLSKPFDPYPYILLNLVLSCLAALQAPVIMMSQNRQEAKDRSRSIHDYQVNLKAELEIEQLHQKIDHLVLHQEQKLLEIQDLQMEMLNHILDKVEEKQGGKTAKATPKPKDKPKP